MLDNNSTCLKSAVDVQVHTVLQEQQKNKYDEVMNIPDAEAADVLGDGSANGIRIKRRYDKRLPKQLTRMEDVLKAQMANHEDVISIQNTRHLMVRVLTDSQSHHWDILRQILEGAKSSGYASQSVDNAFQYSAIYSDTPILEFPGDQSLPLDKYNLDTRSRACYEL